MYCFCHSTPDSIHIIQYNGSVLSGGLQEAGHECVHVTQVT